MDAHPVVAKLDGMCPEGPQFPFPGLLRTGLRGTKRVRLWTLRASYLKDKREIHGCDLRPGLGSVTAGARPMFVGAGGAPSKAFVTRVHPIHPSSPESSPFSSTRLSLKGPASTHPSLPSLSFLATVYATHRSPRAIIALSVNASAP